MTIPTVRGTATTVTGTGTAVVLNVPAGAVVGDLLCMGLSADTAVTVTPPAAFTLNRRLVTADEMQETYLRVVDGSESASYTWTLGTSQAFVAGMFLIKDAVQSTTPHKENGQVNGAGTTVTAPSLTTTLNNCLLIGFFAVDNSASGATTFTSAMTTELFDITTSTWASMAAYSEAFPTAGVTGTRTATASVDPVNGSFGQLLAFAELPVTSGQNAVSAMPFYNTIHIQE